MNWTELNFAHEALESFKDFVCKARFPSFLPLSSLFLSLFFLLSYPICSSFLPLSLNFIFVLLAPSPLWLCASSSLSPSLSLLFLFLPSTVTPPSVLPTSPTRCALPRPSLAGR
ncbi:hypothetical protein FA13DRAFT_1398304 [Coprinellus micaceus]|uniref:Uncharacterized protein n=1 Tax=Coprinellus micaceus TaxID=71717 RepID=A0A4Y7SPT7_COPMI|nr:hypothetical protein FA13DRAFT_1398304 [Coprinellus micaceus]